MLSISSSALSLSLLLLLSSSSSTLPLPLRASHCHPDDAAALLKLRSSFGNPAVWSSWNSASNCCDWEPVSCAPETGRVRSLDIFLNTPISGPISPAVADLRFLEQLTIQSCPAVTGTIPPSIGTLPNLSFLKISGSPRLTGTIPSSLCSLPNLKEIDLSHNHLVGPIPGCFNQNLSRIDFSGNRLSGPVPARLGSGAKPIELLLDRNGLTGPIPRAFGNVDFKILSLSRNLLTGDAAFLLGESKRSLEELTLSRNQLEFDFSNVRLPMGLQKLNLDHNRIYGRVPAQMVKPAWLHLDLRYNNLCGPVPDAVKPMGSGPFGHNKCLCGGPLPPCH